jgi:hypothetical protein
MLCPACGYENEDGVLYCEKCKADLDPPIAPTQYGDLPAEEPVPLEPVGQVFQPSGFEPAGTAPEPPVELEPVALEPVALEPTTTDLPAVPPTPPPLPPKPKTADRTADVDAPTAPTAPAAPTSPKLVVVRGQRMDVQYPIYPGKNYLGRTDDKPVDIDLEDQESQDRIWTSRQHAVVTFEDGKLTVEDLNSLNGTFVNRTRVHPGQVKDLQENDVIQVGTVHLKVVLG